MNSISHEERERRRRAVAFARASVGLEGMTPSVVCMEQAQRFIRGEIDLIEFLQQSPSIVGTPVQER
ncbi:antitoxin VbhA family protein [Janthinobacterium sp. 67]|uniref:antitoxin VbhA family protein n=1 Tax=Janthinobacterium sp. 67 TaxID=2035207 RepID=UPI000C23115E|nr:antitoxin VbhA family protein [Janthinobacterium sp. 67]